MGLGLEEIFKLFMAFLLFTWVAVFTIFIIVGIPLITYDGIYVRPIAAENANQYCREQGFDFYETFSRIGILSREPVAIKCKYVEQYRAMDINLNRKG